MTATFLILAVFTLLAGLAAVSLRNLVHCALCVALAFVGIAALFLLLDAQFIGLAQILISVGAIAVLIVFAILLTRSSGTSAGLPVLSRSWALGLGVALAGLVVMLWAIVNSPSLARQPTATATVQVKSIGNALLTTYVLPLEVVGLLLTAAVIGAAVLATHEKGGQ